MTKDLKKVMNFDLNYFFEEFGLGIIEEREEKKFVRILLYDFFLRSSVLVKSICVKFFV